MLLSARPFGSYAGWYLGARVGFTTAFMVSMVGLGIGLYYGRKIALASSSSDGVESIRTKKGALLRARLFF